MKWIVSAFLSILSAFGYARPVEFSGIVTYVADGDTIHVAVGDSAKVIVRLADIDAPEIAHEPGSKNQPYAYESKQALSQLTKGRHVSLRCITRDKYGRHVCYVDLNGVSINFTMLRFGAAWAASPRFLREKAYAAAQSEAQYLKRGLWAYDDPIEPWIWRRSGR